MGMVEWLQDSHGARMAVWTGNKLDVKGVKLLVPALMKLPHLKSLNFKRAFGMCGVITEEYRTVGGCVDASCVVVWTVNMLGLEAIQALMPALTKLPHLASLDVGSAFPRCGNVRMAWR